MTKLDLHDAVLIGFQWEQAKLRHLGKYGSERAQKAVLMAQCRSFKTDDNPEGDQSIDGIVKAIVEDRPACEFFKEFFNVDVLAWRSHQQRCHSPVGMLP